MGTTNDDFLDIWVRAEDKIERGLPLDDEEIICYMVIRDMMKERRERRRKKNDDQ